MDVDTRPSGPSDPTGHSARPEGHASTSALLKRVLVGRARTSSELKHTLLPKFLALPVFSSDPLSSVAYATEQAMVVLVAASAAAGHLVIPISVAISIVMGIVIVSYRQTVRAYPTAAGSYVVSKDNLGTLPGLIAAGALLIDYVLTVAVSVTAGVLAITSASSALTPYRLELSLGFVVLIALANLRGVREAGLLFALPTYGFVVSVFAMIGIGLIKCASGCPQAVAPSPLPAGVGAVGLFVILHAFSSGSTALTGIEAISNGVSAFRRPQGKNAAKTLAVMGVLAITAFLGVTFLAVQMGARPSAKVSVISEIARATFPGAGGQAGSMFYVVQGFTFAILVLAANTSYQDFPRLSAILARDRFMPRQFENLGDRLVFSNGVVVLTALSCVLIVAFDANVDKLIQLYVVGVFTAFTLSQAGMVVHWRKESRKGDPRASGGWRRRAVVNGIGAVCTGLVTAVVIITKFSHGAWAAILAVPLLVALFRSISRHYESIAVQLRQGTEVADTTSPVNRAVVYVHDLDISTAKAVGYVRFFKGEDFRAVYLQDQDEESPVDIRAAWRWFSRSSVPLEVEPAKGDPAEAFVEAVHRTPQEPGGFVTVVIPEALESRSVISALRHREFRIKRRLLREPGVAVADVPVPIYSGAPAVDPRPLIPNRLVALVPVSAVHDATVRAVNYAMSLRASETRAVFFAFDQEDLEPISEQWAGSGLKVPLDIVDAPFRDLGPPILSEVRRHTGDPDTMVAVVMPELLMQHRHHYLLHNTRALFIKRLLLTEPRVVLTSVPYALGDRAAARSGGG